MDTSLIRNFIYSCDQVLGELQTAQSAEMMDTVTPNRGILGFCVTNYSYYKNQNAAAKVDDLQQQTMRINHELRQAGFFQRGAYPLPTDFSGAAIMQSENAEHSFFANWMTSGHYSSMASANTLHQINNTIAKIQQVRSQAAHVANLVEYGPVAAHPAHASYCPPCA